MTLGRGRSRRRRPRTVPEHELPTVVQDFTATELDFLRMSDEDIEKAIAEIKAALRKMPAMSARQAERTRRPTSCARCASSAASPSTPKARCWSSSATRACCAPRASRSACRRSSRTAAAAGSPPNTACCRARPTRAPSARRRAASSRGRTQEIQRLIGRSLRAVVDLAALGRAHHQARLRRAAGRRRHAHRGDHRRLRRAARRARLAAARRGCLAAIPIARLRRRRLGRHRPGHAGARPRLRRGLGLRLRHERRDDRRRRLRRGAGHRRGRSVLAAASSTRCSRSPSAASRELIARAEKGAWPRLSCVDYYRRRAARVRSDLRQAGAPGRPRVLRKAHPRAPRAARACWRSPAAPATGRSSSRAARARWSRPISPRSRCASRSPRTYARRDVHFRVADAYVLPRFPRPLRWRRSPCSGGRTSRSAAHRRIPRLAARAPRAGRARRPAWTIASSTARARRSPSATPRATPTSCRRLADGSEIRVLKNFPTEADLRAHSRRMRASFRIERSSTTGSPTTRLTMKRRRLASRTIPGKLREIEAILGARARARAAGELGIAEADEPHATFVENALAKARHASRAARPAGARRRLGPVRRRARRRAGRAFGVLRRPRGQPRASATRATTQSCSRN